MTAPALSSSQVNSTNSQTGSTTLTTVVAGLLIVRIACAADAGEVPQFILRVTTTGTLVTEDESITTSGGFNNGTVVYKDGTGGTVSYDHILRTNDSTSAIYIWSIRLNSISGTLDGLSATWTKNGTGTSYKSEASIWTSSGSIPARASRKLSTYSNNGTATGVSPPAYAITRDTGGTSPSQPCLAIGAANAASGTSTAQTVDFDKDGTTTQNNTTIRQATNQQNWFFDGTFDTSDAHLIDATSFNVNFAVNPGAQKAIGCVVYAMESPAVLGTLVLSGGGTLAATGKRTTTGTASLSGGGLLTATGTRKVLGTLLLTGGGTLHANQAGVTTVTGTATLVGGGTFAAAGARLVTGTATITGGGTLAAAGTRKVLGTATFTGGGTFHLTERIDLITFQTGGGWSSSSNRQPGGRTSVGTATLTATATLHMTGTGIGPGHGIASFRGGGTLQATGIRTVVGTCHLSGGGTFLMSTISPFADETRLTLHRTSNVGLARSAAVRLDA